MEDGEVDLDRDFDFDFDRDFDLRLLVSDLNLTEDPALTLRECAGCCFFVSNFRDCLSDSESCSSSSSSDADDVLLDAESDSSSSSSSSSVVGLRLARDEDNTDDESVTSSCNDKNISWLKYENKSFFVLVFDQNYLLTCRC
jgi:hypothetical protein